jgi:hypothetical protein
MARYLVTYYGSEMPHDLEVMAAEGPILGWSVIEAPDPDGAATVLTDHPFSGRGGVLQINHPVEF